MNQYDRRVTAMYILQHDSYFFNFFVLYSSLCEKIYSIFRILLLLYSIYIFKFFIFECYNLLMDLVPQIIKYTERKKINLNVTLPSQISSRN